ncbi:Alpha/Beta hydrolase protein [Mycena floridula]|nr:Alpha/Beta hydrolase protein [Mycena floridula]
MLPHSLLLVGVVAAFKFLLPAKATDPVATVRNGTLQGFHTSSFNQDMFYGIPFAEPPIGDLRFRHPQSLNSSWKGIRDATHRSESCAGYGGLDIGLELGEDCLTLDIVRPVLDNPTEKLPVAVWIYGGGFTAGGSADTRYNLSYFVQGSVDIGKPIIAVAINYRLSGFGFLASDEVLAEGSLNAGLYDQRLALRWIQENIAAFNGDPEKVTIWGESAGAFSVALHLGAFDGQSGGLFRGAIMQSGTSLGLRVLLPEEFKTTVQVNYDTAVASTGCEKSTATLDCLRNARFEDLFAAFSVFAVTPVVDGDFIRRLPSESFSSGKIANVAVLVGANSDEGTAGPRGTLQTEDDVRALIAGIGRGLDDATVEKLLTLYPDDPTIGCPYGTGEERFESQGHMYKRGASILGDLLIIAGRRAVTQYFAGLANDPRKNVWSYQFDQSTWNNQVVFFATVQPVYATHFAEICYVFNNPSLSNTNWIGPFANHSALASSMSRYWASFVHDLDPNYDSAVTWPEYGETAENIVFQVDNIFAEKDDWRKEAMEAWTTIWKQVGS